VRIIVPQPPGGGFDSVGRLLADRMGKQMGQSFVVENRAGSGTLVGTDLAAKAPADGYTLLVGSVSNLALNPGLYPNLPYDSLKDFEPIGLLVSYSYTLMARKDLPFRTLQDVIAYAKANPGKLNYASAGNGSGQHVLAAALWHLAKRGRGARAVPRRAARLPGPAGRPRRPVLRPLADGARAGRRRQCARAGRVRRRAQPDAPAGAHGAGNRRRAAGAGVVVRPVRAGEDAARGAAACAPTSPRWRRRPTCRRRWSRAAASRWR
jgi:hypothetical protein